MGGAGNTAVDKNAEYKEQFRVSYDQAGARAVQLGRDVTVARLIMKRLGYTDAQLDLAGDAVGRMQGVGNPHPRAAIAAGETVVDLGCGLGIDALLAAAAAGPRGRVIGVDISATEVAAAKELAVSRRTDGGGSIITFVVGDMEAIPAEDDSVDVVISNGGFCLVPDKPKAFGEIHRILKPGGRMVICCTTNKLELAELDAGVQWPACMEVFMQLDQVDAIVRAAGFGDVGVDDSDSKMDVWDLEEDAVAGAIAASQDTESCSHARKAAARQLAELRERQQIRADEKTGVHWGDPKYEHLQARDINSICARVCISAHKPGKSGKPAIAMPTTVAAARAASVGEREPNGLGVQVAAAGLLGVAAVTAVALRGRGNRLLSGAAAVRGATRRVR